MNERAGMDDGATASLAQLAQSVLKPKAYACEKCERSFDKPAALRMHVLRVHNMKPRRPKFTREEILEHKRIYNAKWRARNRRKGLTSGGTPRKLPFTRHPIAGTPGQSPSHEFDYKRRKYYEQVARYRAMGLNAHGQPYKIKNGAALRNIQNAQAERRAKERAGLTESKPSGKRIRYVYPPSPGAVAETGNAVPTPEKTDEVDNYIRAQLMKFCPCCGENLSKWEKKI